ncbi:MAG: RraA family protein [Planctomycetota bacterium]
MSCQSTSKSRCIGFVGMVLFLVFVAITAAQGSNRPKLFTPRGVQLLPNKSFDDSNEARKEILDLYKDLRITDVLDGLDLIGLPDITLMRKDIRPLWRDTEDFSHRIVGFAITVRHVPTNARIGQNSFTDVNGIREWIRREHRRSNCKVWTEVIRPGDVAVIDCSGILEGGHTGSRNSLRWAEKGLVGVITNSGIRDTDEVIKVKKIPVYCKDGYSSRGIISGRILCESYNFPINCGGVVVFPGDLIVADGDGVIVVPREYALTVGKIAMEIHISDEKARARHYKRLGIPMDETVIVESKGKAEK